MLACFSALNESSNLESSGDSSEESEEIPEYQDEDFLPLYNDALSKYGCEDYTTAERKFRKLLESDYFRQCGWECPKPRPVATKLQYNSFRYLGLCLAKRSSWEECLDCLQNAINIDNTDRTLYFKFAVFATKAGRLHQARSALEASLSLNQPHTSRPTYPHVKHWPTLDLLISLTYKLGDFISTLRYIELALLDDEKYEKGLRVRTKIYEECPYLNPDPSKHNDTPIMHSVIVTMPRKVVEIVVTPLQMTSLSITRLGECLIEEYSKCGQTEKLLNPCTISVIEPTAEDVSMKENQDDDIQIIQDNIEDMDCDVMIIEKDNSTFDMIKSIVDEIVMTATRPSRDEFIMSLVMDMITDVVTNSNENPIFFAPSRRRGATSAFLSEVPLDLMEIRRSSRGKGAYGDDLKGGEEETAKSLLESYLPPSLKLTEDKIKADEKKQQIEASPVKSNQKSEEKLPTLISPDEEKNLARELLDSETFRQNFSVIDGLTEFLLSVSEKFANRKWPIAVSDVFLRCYLSWRRHNVLPDDEDHPYLNVIILANEIVLGEAYNKSSSPQGVKDADNSSETEDGDAEEDEEDKMTEFVEEDMNHLKFKLFNVSKPSAVRIFSLNIQFYKWQEMTSEALSIGENMKDFLNRFYPEGKAFSPVESYGLVSGDNLDSFLESLRTNSMISRVSALYEDKTYETVQHILSSYLTKKKRKGAHYAGANALRSYHLCMMIESLWNLEDYSSSLSWAEVAVHEALEDKEKKRSGDEDDDKADAETSKEIFDLLKMIECCVAMMDGEFNGLDSFGKSRLSKNLLDLVLSQVEGKEDAGLGVKTVMPWILLHKLILFEESKSDNESGIPGSIEFLCSAHDYLGPLGLCTIENGQLLRLLIDKTVRCLAKVQGQKALVDHLSKHLDQALYCLYAHPSKKSKLKHLVDHGVSNVAFTWEQCLSPYLFLRPEKLPEFDDFKSNSISAETMAFFKRIVAVVPDNFDIDAREAFTVKYLKTDSDNFPRYPKSASSEEEFPRQLRDLFYLLADHFFKNNEFPTALKYYRIDLTLNAQRVDSWFAMALALGNGLEPKINETNKDSGNVIVRITSDVVKQILSDGEEVMRCFKLCFRLTPHNTTIQIESANFAYVMFSFCSRRENDCENMSMELFTRIEKLKNYFLNFALDHYNEALKQMEGQDPNSMSTDERWLLFLMKGKILGKKKKPIKESLAEYMKAMDNLLFQGAAPLPKRISFNSPPELALELLEVYYRIHATILKEEFGDEFPPSRERIAFFKDVLDKVERTNLFDPTRTGKDERSQSSETDTMFESPPAKMSKMDEDAFVAEGNTDLHLMWEIISQKCLRGLEMVTNRFPQHFKALHLLSHYYLKSEKAKDIKKVQRFLWGNEPATSTPAGGAASSAGGNANKVSALFGERKSSNLFNGIWRLPNSEFDRAGNFSTHMGKCTTTLLELALQLKDAQILFDVAWQLRKPADGDRKYLFERERVALEKQALTMMRQILRSKTDELLQREPVKEDGEKGEERLMEERGLLLLDAYQYFFKVKRWWHTKDEAIVCMLLEIYGKIVGKTNATFDEVSSFCQRLQILDKGTSSTSGGAGPGRKGAAMIDSSQTTPTTTVAKIKSAKESMSATCSKASSSNSQATASAQAASNNAAIQAATAAMMSNYLATSTSYYTEMAKMMGVDPATMAAAVSAEAYLNLARYSGLLDRGSVSIAPVGGSSAGTSKASGQGGAIRKSNVTSKASPSSLVAMKKPLTGSVTKPLQRKSLDPKLISSSSKSPYFGSTKTNLTGMKKPGIGTLPTYGGSVPNLSKTNMQQRIQQQHRQQQLQLQRKKLLAAAATASSVVEAGSSSAASDSATAFSHPAGASKMFSALANKQLMQHQRMMAAKMGLNPKLSVTSVGSAKSGQPQRPQSLQPSRPQGLQLSKAVGDASAGKSILKSPLLQQGNIARSIDAHAKLKNFPQTAPKSKPRPKPPQQQQQQPPPSSGGGVVDDDVICID